MRMLSFASRNAKEILRDPINLFFGLGFPVVLLVLLSAIQSNIPVSLFEIEHLSCGVTVFGLSFMTLFSATIISKDRGTSFLQGLDTSPLTSCDFIFAYTLPIIPIALSQSVVCYAVALLFKLELSINVLFALLSILPSAIFFISLGLLCGSVFNDKQVGGICGALLTNLCAFLSGVWFDLKLVGGVFEKIANILPFIHCVEVQRAVLLGEFADIFPHIYIVLAYALVTLVLAVLLFLRQMKKQ